MGQHAQGSKWVYRHALSKHWLGSMRQVKDACWESLQSQPSRSREWSEASWMLHPKGRGNSKDLRVTTSMTHLGINFNQRWGNALLGLRFLQWMVSGSSKAADCVSFIASYNVRIGSVNRSWALATTLLDSPLCRSYSFYPRLLSSAVLCEIDLAYLIATISESRLEESRLSVRHFVN